MTHFPEKEGFQGDKRDIKDPSIDALALLKQCVVDRPPEFKHLPKSIRVDSRLNIMPEGREAGGVEIQSISEVSDELLKLQKEHTTECGRAIVANHEDELQLGPYCQGDEHSVRIIAPLKETEIVTPSGLVVCRHDKIVASMHSHSGDHSFSLQDFYVDFSQGVKQMYVIKGNGVLDMAQITDDTRLLSEDVFRRLLSLWETYLLPNGELRSDLGPEEHLEFLHRISESVLKIGFYSNEDSGNPSELKLREWKK
jgi:hypothetical protein